MKKSSPPASRIIPTKFALLLLSFLPLLPLFFLLLAGGANQPQHDDLLVNIDAAIILPYFLTTCKMVLATGGLAVIIGMGLAWFFEFFSFPGKKILSWLVLMPFATPPYIVAMVYVEQLSPNGILGQWLYNWLGFFNPRDWRLAAVVLSLCFYPYVYLLARSFLSSSLHVTRNLEMARVLGFPLSSCFWRLFLPLMLPQMMAGFILVGLEVMADYGAMNFFAVKTLSMGMFDLWLNLGQINYARYFCFIILLLVSLFLIFDYIIQNFHLMGWRLQRKSTLTTGRGASYHRPEPLSRMGNIALLTCLGILLFFAIGLPFLSLLSWFIAPLWHGLQMSATNYLQDWLANITDTLPALLTTFGFATVAGLSILFFSLIIGFAERQWHMPLLRLPLVIGYAMPGVVLGLGMLILGFALVRGFFSQADDASQNATYYNIAMLSLLFYGYLAKFSASCFGAISAGYRAISLNIDHAARVLGETPIAFFGNFLGHAARKNSYTHLTNSLPMAKKYNGKKKIKNWSAKAIGGVLGFVHLPLLRPALFSGFLIAFIEIIKELPITLVLRPFGVETLSLRLFTFVSDERIKMAALPGLLIILVSMISIWLAKHHWLRRED